eukprot:TRINITY_DN24677_c0_g1_i1.p1 TRINITY_DN24677_c0_g1~~TRINITY_DN24677_c0_g1_i1.p1  ORF type:complete len:587 (-),score=117.43 TRINITY_DN24677_c0_g1_i1:189-1949(-)
MARVAAHAPALDPAFRGRSPSIDARAAASIAFLEQRRPMGNAPGFRRPSGAGPPDGNNSRRNSKSLNPAFQAPKLPSEVQGGLGIVGHTGQVIVTASAPSQRRVCPKEGSSTARVRSNLASAGAKSLAGAGAPPPLSARSELPPLPWAAAAAAAAAEAAARLAAEGGRGGGGAATGGGGATSSSRPPPPKPLDELGKDDEPTTASRLTPSSQVKLRSLDSTLDKLQSDSVRQSPVSLWQKNHTKVVALHNMIGEHDHRDLRGAADATDLGASSGEMSTSCGSAELLSLGGTFDSQTAGAELVGTENGGASASFQTRLAWSGKLQDQDAASQQGFGTAGMSAALGASGSGVDAMSQAPAASSHPHGRGADDGEGDGAGEGTAPRRHSRTRTSTLASSRGSSKKKTTRQQDGTGSDNAASWARRRASGESKDDEDDEQEVDADVQDDLLDKFLEELFALYSTARDNRGRPLMDNMGVRRFLQDFCIGPDANAGAAKVAKIAAQADILYENEIERQGNMNFMFDLSKGEASRGLTYKAFTVLLRQVNMAATSREMSRRWFCKYAPRGGSSSAVEVAVAMFDDHGGAVRF